MVRSVVHTYLLAQVTDRLSSLKIWNTFLHKSAHA